MTKDQMFNMLYGGKDLSDKLTKTLCETNFNMQVSKLLEEGKIKKVENFYMASS